MRIAFFASGWPPDLRQNGIVTYVGVMRESLRAAGHEVVVITPNAIYDEAGERPAAERLGQAAGRLFRRATGRAAVDSVADYAAGIAESLKRLHREKRVDIFEMEETFGHALAIERATGVPTVMRLHGPHFLVKFGSQDERDVRRIRLEKDALAAIKVITAPSKKLIDAVGAHYSIDTAHIRPVPNPILMPKAADCWSPANADPNLILFVGRMDLCKGADVMIDAFARVLQSHRSARLVMVGPDNRFELSDGEIIGYQKYAERFVEKSVSDRITYLGRVSADEVSKLRKTAGVYVSASRYENFPYSVLESLAIGAPTIMTANNGLREFVTDGTELAIAPEEDAEALADEITAFLDQPARAAEMGVAGRAAVAREFAPEIVLKKTVDAYKARLSIGGD